MRSEVWVVSVDQLCGLVLELSHLLLNMVELGAHLFLLFINHLADLEDLLFKGHLLFLRYVRFGLAIEKNNLG